MTRPAAGLLFGEVMHRRLFPVRYRFVYRVFSLLLDLDRLDELAAGSRWFSHNRFNLLAFHDRDHGPRDGSPLKPWLLARLREQGLEVAVARVELQCFPRLLGYGFNPLSIWTCFDAEDRPLAVLCEVHNTFGESHSYLLHEDGAPLRWPIRARHAKDFHVSPFIGMAADYQFRFARDGQQHSVVIREFQEERLMLAAVHSARLLPCDDAGLLRAALSYPLMTLKVMLMIHWQALKIWLRGGRYHAKPEPPREEVS
ncbi:hypothetical protein MARPU_03200 [Marichromatium purpuratum 984]|uniref:DUF1365 domain-containing protein n=1 Tax=Marichromatium purpuratum 984 TaxID=765910 RepID=W0E191_MARPU|nr:DUF1365 domain-containing protein [Marichromatium purpuratum]AHF02989.1 hypothetical protein MARPU_03200 [Marichromatium purpuratum 984]